VALEAGVRRHRARRGIAAGELRTHARESPGDVGWDARQATGFVARSATHRDVRIIGSR
jgi:hypothetical protein